MRRFITLLLIGLVSIVRGGDIVFIVGEDTKIYRLTKDQVREIYLKEINFINGVEVVPVNLPAGNPLRKIVEEKVIGLSGEMLRIYWNRKYVYGVEPPIVLNSEKAVVKFVKKVKGAIGYVREENLDEGVREVYRLKVYESEN